MPRLRSAQRLRDRIRGWRNELELREADAMLAASQRLVEKKMVRLLHVSEAESGG